MSYALETKKRKFHRVLESLTRPLNGESSPKLTSASSAPSLEHAPSAKRARLSGLGDGDFPSVRKKTFQPARPSSSNSSSSFSPRPSFVPWDRDRFLERLETFRRVDRWSPKPSAINEVEWAKRGWVCSDVSRVTCAGGCGGSVVVKLPDELDELDGYDSEKIQERKEVRTKLVNEYANLVIQGHGENCPWRNKGCDATIHRLPLANPDTAISGLQTRYSHLLKMADKLPSLVDLQLPEHWDLQAIISVLPLEGFQGLESQVETTPTQPPAGGDESQQRELQTSTHPEPAVNESAFVLAFFGWDSVADGAVGLAGCGACFRRLGLWMYKPRQDGKSSAHDPLDVVNEHMEYCPWINGKTQSGTGKPSEKMEGLRSGWELLAQGLKVKHLRYIRSTEPIGSRAGSEAPSVGDSVAEETSDDTKKAKDREWWAKIRRMRQVLNVKSPKPKT
ncbi:hypothetical protein AOCH_003356 [Aspergillus ochraceoroseus]|uniref:C3HC zinc finger domain protein n=1 Tax=Aspergillus ochraceoroseus TaxID=138278 RepID=A0A0F8USB9_9EURO|nr:hypothetical protein AOCH_003356 [Aspergillus ochraceoroseus]